MRLAGDHQRSATAQQLASQDVVGVDSRRLDAVVQGDRAGEDAAAAGVRRVFQGAAHGVHELVRDGEPEPGAAVDASRGGVTLGEGLEEVGQLRVRTPTPVSATSTLSHTRSSSGSAVAADGNHAVLGELHGVRDQVGDHLRQPRRVAPQHGRDVRVTRHHEVQPLLAGQLGEHGGHLLQQQPDVEVQPLQLQPAGLDLGEVEDVVDQPEQRPAGRDDPRRQPVLLGGERRAEQEVVEADHAVERRPDLVAHGGQEVRLLA